MTMGLGIADGSRLAALQTEAAGTRASCCRRSHIAWKKITARPERNRAAGNFKTMTMI